MKILISGASGFVGSQLVKLLESKGHEVYQLVRSNDSDKKKILWNLDENYIDTSKFVDFDAVINLAGENLFSLRWSKKKKQRLVDTRVEATKLIHYSLKGHRIYPSVWINASAAGYYGNTGDKIKTEEDKPGNVFLANLCEQWEMAAYKASDICERIVILRFGIILEKNGGFLSKLLPFYRKGVAVQFGSGKNYFSHIAREDIINIINFALENDGIEGAYNAVSPQQLTQKEFVRALSDIFSCPLIFVIPEAILRLVFGEIADGVLLNSLRLSSEKLQQAGYKFIYQDLKSFLKKEFESEI